MITDPGQPYATLDWTRPDLTEHLAMYNLTANFNQGSLFDIGVTNLTRIVMGPCGRNITYNYDINVTGEYLGMFLWKRSQKMKHLVITGSMEMSFCRLVKETTETICLRNLKSSKEGGEKLNKINK